MGGEELRELRRRTGPKPIGRRRLDIGNARLEMLLLRAQQPPTLQRAELLAERAGLGSAAGGHGDVPENPTVL